LSYSPYPTIKTKLISINCKKNKEKYIYADKISQNIVKRQIFVFKKDTSPKGPHSMAI
jgi:hypothetical protein